MNTKTAPESLANTIREHVATLHTRRADLIASRDQARAEIEAHYTDPLNRDDAKQFCLDYIDAQAKRIPTVFAAVIADVARPRRYSGGPAHVPGVTKGDPLNLRDVDAGLSGDAIKASERFSDGLDFIGAGSGTMKSASTMYFFFGDIIKAKLADHLDTLYPKETGKPGLPVAERRQRIAELETRIVELNAEIAGIDAELASIRSGAATEPRQVLATQSAKAAPRTVTPAEMRRINYGIYHDFNGRNAEELAERYDVTRAHVESIVRQSFAPEQ